MYDVVGKIIKMLPSSKSFAYSSKETMTSCYFLFWMANPSYCCASVISLLVIPEEGVIWFQAAVPIVCFTDPEICEF